MTLDDPAFYLEIAERFLTEAALRDSPGEVSQLLALGERYLDLADEVRTRQESASPPQASMVELSLTHAA